MSEQNFTEYSRKFNYWIEHRTLVYVSFVKPRQGPRKLWGRIISFEPLPGGDANFILYNDDSKQIESISLYSVDDFQPEVDPDFADGQAGEGSAAAERAVEAGAAAAKAVPGRGAKAGASAAKAVPGPVSAEAAVPTSGLGGGPEAAAGTSRLLQELDELTRAMSAADVELLLLVARRMAANFTAPAPGSVSG